MRIETASVDDAPGIAAVHLSSLRASHEPLLPDRAAHLVVDAADVEGRARSWRSWIERSRVSTFVARVDGEVQGFSTLHPMPGEPSQRSTAELSALFVAESHWRHGLGRRLCERTLTEARERGFSEVVLWVLEVNDRARRFYELMGFRPDGETRVFLEVASGPLLELRYRRSTTRRSESTASKAIG